jgi:hypothetical protein
MKNKKIVKLLALVLVLFPSIAFAQWALPDSFGLPGGTIGGIIENIALWILVILGIVGIIGFVISGIMYLLSAGNEGRIETAKKAMVASIIGVVVGLAGYVVIQAIATALDAGFF